MFSKIFIIFLFSFYPTFSVQSANPSNIVINEIAWMGTEVSYKDEWIELYNNSSSTINLDDWLLKAADGSPEIELSGNILAKGFFLLERTDDDTVSNISADQIYTGSLKNDGEKLELYDNFSNLIDSVDCSTGWFAGDNKTKQTMERKDPQFSGSDSENWISSQNPGGTPKAKNSVFQSPIRLSEPKLEFLPEISTSTSEIKEKENNKVKIKESTFTPSKKLEKSQDKKQLAALREQFPQSSNFTLLVAINLAIFSGVIILILKKKIKESKEPEV
jgi:hypothetical protein